MHRRHEGLRRLGAEDRRDLRQDRQRLQRRHRRSARPRHACTGPGINTTRHCNGGQRLPLRARSERQPATSSACRRSVPGIGDRATASTTTATARSTTSDRAERRAIRRRARRATCRCRRPTSRRARRARRQCVAGKMVCMGAVGPMPNQCNGISTDCTGNPNTNGNCPTGFQCYQGNCVAPCAAGRVPLPGRLRLQP